MKITEHICTEKRVEQLSGDRCRDKYGYTFFRDRKGWVSVGDTVKLEKDGAGAVWRLWVNGELKTEHHAGDILQEGKLIDGAETVRARTWCIAHPYKFHIFKTIEARPGITVTELQIAVREDSQPVISRHLADLRIAGLVKAERDGKYKKYYVVEDQLNRLKMAIELFNKTV